MSNIESLNTCHKDFYSTYIFDCFLEHNLYCFTLGYIIINILDFLKVNSSQTSIVPKTNTISNYIK